MQLHLGKAGVAALCASLILAGLLAACSDKPAGIKLGFLGGVSGRVADLGTGGRDGVILAVEQANQAGGINGSPIELLIRDDQQNPALAKQHVRELLSQPVTAILGPMTSSIAMAVVPMANDSNTLMMGITTTTKSLSNQDDYFFRAIGSTDYHAAKIARLLYLRGYRTFNVAIDINNRAYTESWLDDFSTAMAELGGEVATVVRYASSDNEDFVRIAAELLAGNPDGVALVANSVDAALIATHVRKSDDGVILVGSEWSATERLIELGGSAVEGMITAQYFDRHNTSPGYLEFREAYVKRFGKTPGFPGVVAYNAANILIRGLREKQPDETLKQALLRIQQFSGLQTPIVINDKGDTNTGNYVTEIRDGSFHVIDH